MTEEEWLECAESAWMIEFLQGKSTDRKLRLFAVACCRQVWHFLATKECRKAVEVSELMADDASYRPELAQACKKVWDQNRDWHGISSSETTRKGASYMAAANASTTEMWHIKSVVECTQTLSPRSGIAALQRAWLRDIIGNPFDPNSINLNWLTPTVTNLATAAYEYRDLPSGVLDTATLAILADALEDEGCDNAELLNHLRSPGPHFRGCFALDLLLGKE